MNIDPSSAPTISQRVLDTIIASLASIAFAYSTCAVHAQAATSGWLGASHTYPSNTAIPFTTYQYDCVYVTLAVLAATTLMLGEIGGWFRGRRMIRSVLRGGAYGLLLGAAWIAAKS